MEKDIEDAFTHIGDSITQGLSANRKEMSNGLNAHREEMRQTLKTSREDTSREIGQVRDQVTRISNDFNKHSVEAGRAEEQIDSRARSAHHRIDETNDRISDIEDKKEAKIEKRSMKVWAFWGVVAAAVIGGAFTLIVTLLSENKDEASETGAPDPIVVSE